MLCCPILIFLTAQREFNIDSPAPQDLYSVGTVGLILRMIRVKDSNKMKVLVQGIRKAGILEFIQNEPFYISELGKKEADKSEITAHESKHLITKVKGKLDKLVFNHGKTFPADILVVIENLDDPEKLAHLIAANIGLDVSRAQERLETEKPILKLIKLATILDEQIGNIQK